MSEVFATREKVKKEQRNKVRVGEYCVASKRREGKAVTITDRGRVDEDLKPQSPSSALKVTCIDLFLLGVLASNFLCLLSDIDNSYRPKTLPSTLLILPWTGPDFGVSDVLAFWFPSLSPPRRRCLKARRIPLVSPPVAVEVAEDEDDTDFAVDDPSPSSALRLAAFFSSMFLIIFDFSILFMINLFSRLA